MPDTNNTPWKESTNGNKNNLSKDNQKDEDDNIFSVIVEFIVVVLKCIYYWLELLYFTIVPLPPKSVKGEIVLITGGGQGIGRELCFEYASHGATVVACDIDKENNEDTVNEINNRGGPKAYSFVCDVSNRADILRVAQEVRSNVGNVTILVNNAGIMPSRLFLNYDEQLIRKIMDINVMAHYWFIQEFLPNMIEKDHGHIVSISSMCGQMGVKNLVPYCTSKFAARGLLEALEEELRSDNINVKLTTICPYMVNTGLLKNHSNRFSFYNPLDKTYVAKEIVRAQRTNAGVISIPRNYAWADNLLRLGPIKVKQALLDYFQNNVHCDF